jgi:hypothetical protein
MNYFSDKILAAVRARFPKSISIEETKYNTMKGKGLLFRKSYNNDYCFLETNKGSKGIIITLFQSHWKNFDDIENDFDSDHFSFSVESAEEIKFILNRLV